MREKLIRFGKIALVTLLVILLICLGIKKVTKIDTNSVDNVSIKYVLDRATYESNFLGGFTKCVSTKDTAVLEECIAILDEIDRLDKWDKGGHLNPAFPNYTIELKEGRTLKASIMVTANEALISSRPFGTRVMDYSPKNPYFYQLRDLMAELEARAK